MEPLLNLEKSTHTWIAKNIIGAEKKKQLSFWEHTVLSLLMHTTLKL